MYIPQIIYCQLSGIKFFHSQLTIVFLSAGSFRCSPARFASRRLEPITETGRGSANLPSAVPFNSSTVDTSL